MTLARTLGAALSTDLRILWAGVSGSPSKKLTKRGTLTAASLSRHQPMTCCSESVIPGVFLASPCCRVYPDLAMGDR